MNEMDTELWLKCPYCDRKTKTKVISKTVLLHFPLYCPWCRKEYLISLVGCNITVEKYPEDKCFDTQPRRDNQAANSQAFDLGNVSLIGCPE